MNIGNLTYAVARATEASRESGEATVVGFVRDEDTFLATEIGSNLHCEMEWMTICSEHGLIYFNDEDDYAKWAMEMEYALQSHIAAAAKSGEMVYIDDNGVEFVEV